VTPEELRQLRQDLQCTARELAATIGLDPNEVVAWEQGERFPTKKVVNELNQLRQLGPSAIVRKKNKNSSRLSTPPLADPRFWALIRKLLEHPELFSKAQALAEDYPDPAAARTDTP
jgi:transcriptional regulator with XRE-family HTH domain